MARIEDSPSQRWLNGVVSDDDDMFATPNQGEKGTIEIHHGDRAYVVTVAVSEVSEDE